MVESADKAAALQLLKKLDKDNSGFLDKEELRVGIKLIYREIDLRMTDADIDRLIQTADKNHDGRIEIEEFMELI